MKHVFRLILVLLLTGCLIGCHYSESGDILEPVEFYYPRNSASFVYGAADGVITAEIREASGHVGDLNYLISMYLRGPQDTALRSPFPAGCKLEGIRTEESTLHVFLSSEFATLEGTDLTLACAALARTCLSMTQYQYICIDAVSEDQTVSVILDDASLLLADYSVFTPATEPQ